MKSQDPLPPRIVTVLGELKTFCSQKMTTSHQLMATPTIPCRGHPVSLVNFTEPMLSELTAQLMAGRRKPRRSPWRSVPLPTPSPHKADPFCTFVVEDLGKICLTGAFWVLITMSALKIRKSEIFLAPILLKVISSVKIQR